MPLPRPCDKCKMRFLPNKKERLCPKCRNDVKNVNFIKLICHRKGLSIKKLNQHW